MKITPFGNNVLLKLIPREKSDIVIPNVPGIAKDESSPLYKYIVVAVGEGQTLPNGTIKPIPFNRDDEVLVAQAQSMELDAKVFSDDGKTALYITNAVYVVAKAESEASDIPAELRLARPN